MDGQLKKLLKSFLLLKAVSKAQGKSLHKDVPTNPVVSQVNLPAESSAPNQDTVDNVANIHWMGTIVNRKKKKKKSDFLKAEPLEKEERPFRPGQVSSHGKYIADYHKDNGNLVWHYHPEIAHSTDRFIAQNKDKYMARIKPEYRGVVSDMFDHVLKDPNRHVVAAFDKVGGTPAIRARHLKSLIEGQGHVKLQGHGPNDISLKAVRHGLGSNYNEQHVMPFSNRSKLAASEMFKSEMKRHLEEMGHFQKSPLSPEVTKLHDDWTGHNILQSDREKLHTLMMDPVHQKERGAMLRGLAMKVPTQEINGMRHYLLHRRHGPIEGDTVTHKKTTSYSTHPKEKMHQILSGGNIHSAWIPENKISYSYEFSLPHHLSEPDYSHGHEGEVIVGAGTYPVHDKFYQTSDMKTPMPGHTTELAASEGFKKADWRKSYKLNKDEPKQPTVLYHYSRQPGLKEIDPKQMGTGTPGSFNRRFNPSQIKDFPHTSFHYIQDTPEDIVRGGARSKYTLKLDPDTKLYDMSRDPEKLVHQAVQENQGAWNYENVLNKIKNAGYHGTWASRSENPVISNTVQLFHPHPVHLEEGV